MRNVSFSIMLGALALLQIAVVAGELYHSSAQTAAARREAATRYLVASSPVVAEKQNLLR